MSPEEELKRAGRAREILENELFKEAVIAIEGRIKDARMQSATGATDLREKLWAQELGLYAIVQELRTHIETGQLAERSLMDKAKDFFNA